MKTNFIKICQTSCWAVLVFLALTITACSSDDDGPGNQAPDKTTLSGPVDSATNVAVTDLELKWAAAVDPNDDPVSYQVYLDTINPPVAIVNGNITETSLKLSDNLEYSTTYYWSVIAKDNSDAKSHSEVATFTTEDKDIDQMLLGKWMIEGAIVEGSNVEAGSCLSNSYFEFKQNGELRFVAYQGDPCTNVADETYFYQATDQDTLVLTLSTDATDATIVKIVTLTDTHLELLMEENLQYKFS